MMVQDAPAVRVAGQLLVCAKTLGLLPVMVTATEVSEAVPELVRVMLWVALVVATGWVKLSVELESVTAEAMPVPARNRVWGEFGASSIRSTSAGREPATVGVKLTEMVQVAAGASVAAQVVVWL